jgi:hypothetical protein
MISAIMPTTGRANQAKNAAMQFFHTTRGHEAELIALVDNGDKDTLHALLDVKHEPLLIRMFYGQHGPVKLWNEGAKVACGELLMLYADDLWAMPGWLEAVLECHEQNPTHVIGINDMSRGDDLGAHYIATRQTLREVLGGVLVVPHYYSQYLDLEVTDKAKRLGRYTWCKGARLEHRHRAFGKAANDETYSVGDQHMGSDCRTWQLRQAAGYLVDYAGYL